MIYCHMSDFCCHYAEEDKTLRESGGGPELDRGPPKHANTHVFYRSSILDHFHTLILRKLGVEILRCVGTRSTFKTHTVTDIKAERDSARRPFWVV